jgi:hypothetical protein
MIRFDRISRSLPNSTKNTFSYAPPYLLPLPRLPLGAHVDCPHGLVTGFAIDKGVICGSMLGRTARSSWIARLSPAM